MTSEEEEVVQLRLSRTQVRVNQSFTAAQDGDSEGNCKFPHAFREAGTRTATELLVPAGFSAPQLEKPMIRVSYGFKKERTH